MLFMHSIYRNLKLIFRYQVFHLVNAVQTAGSVWKGEEREVEVEMWMS